MLQEAAKDKLKSEALGWIDRIHQNQFPKWLILEEKLKIFKSCSGHLGRDFGYSRKTPKAIIFFESDLGDVEILSSKIHDQQRNGRDLHISSLAAKDLNFDWMKNEGFFAEHGQTSDLIAADHLYGTRRFERLLEEAAEICTSEMIDPRQRDFEMAALQEALSSRSLAFVDYEYTATSSNAYLEIVFKIDSMIFMNKIHKNFKIF